MRARASHPIAHVVVLVVVILALVAVPVAARPYGAAGRAGEIRYDVAPAKPRCEAVYDSAGRRTSMCFHRTTTGAHRSTATWTEHTIKAFKDSWNKQVKAMRYRRPLADAGAKKEQGPNTGIDIYLADIGDDGTFGYCTNDRNPDPDGDQRIPAYCVVDNDFAEFSRDAGERLLELKGTAAHEFFHAVHYAYDHTVPPWLSEGTAVWMEDQVFDRGNTNRRYLDITALRQPEDPLDKSGTGYGGWLFWQFLSECSTPATVRSVWSRVGKATGSEADVFRAVKGATGKGLGPNLASFGAWNYALGADWSYGEGGAYLKALGSRPPVSASHELTATRGTTDATGAAGVDRVIEAGARSVHYVAVRATVDMVVGITVNVPSGAARITHAPGATPAFPRPALCGAPSGSAPSLFGTSNTRSTQLDAGESLVLVLSNPTGVAKDLTYRVVAR